MSVLRPMHPAIESFIVRLRDRPWIDSNLVTTIEVGLRTAIRDPNPALWEKLRHVIDDDDELTVEEQLTQIGRITAAHLSNERARRVSQ
jgi:hypothetical protein